MPTFAVLYTCFNRKTKTISSLKALYSAYENFNEDWKMDIYLTDDGSTDGTSIAVRERFPEVHILKGSGELYWAGGMRNSWTHALKKGYDAYLLLNDDTNIKSDLFSKIIDTNDFSYKNHDRNGIYVGATMDSDSRKISYGGYNFKNRFLATTIMLPVNNNIPQLCELGNANIMWVPSNIVEEIGILSKGYIHGMADYDYTLKAVEKDIPVWLIPGISGECVNDHSNPYDKFMNLNFKDRIKMLYSPLGLDFSSQVHHMKKHFPLRYPIFYLIGWFKVFFPKWYFKGFHKRRMA